MRRLYLSVLLLLAAAVLAHAEPVAEPEKPAAITTSVQDEYQLGLDEYSQGRYEASIFALERALAMQPDFHDARFAIIRAYIATGEYVSANVELDSLAQANLTDEQRRQVTGLHQNILAGMEKGRRKWQGSIALGVGTDSNINAGPDSNVDDQYGTSSLINGTQSLDDSFAELSADIQYTRFTDSGYMLFAGGRLENRLYGQEGDFDALTLAAFGGMIFEAGDEQYRLSVLAQQYSVEGQTGVSGDQQQLGAQLHWKHRLDSRRHAGAFMQAASIGYPDQPARDVTQLVAGVSWDQTFQQALKPVMSARLYTAVDQEAEASRQDMGRSFNGLQLGINIQPDAGQQGYCNLSYQQSDYDAEHPDFHLVREDTLTHIVLGWVSQLGDDWQLQPEARYTRNSSNLAVNDFDRSQLMLQARRQFK